MSEAIVVAIIGGVAKIIGAIIGLKPKIIKDKPPVLRLTITPINDRGMNVFGMSLGSDTFAVLTNFHLKPNTKCKIVKLSLGYGPNHYPMEQHIQVDGENIATGENHTTLLRPIVLAANESKRMMIRRKFLASMPRNFDKDDVGQCEGLREDLDYGDVTIALDVDVLDLQEIIHKELVFKLEPGGKLQEVSGNGGSKPL